VAFGENPSPIRLLSPTKNHINIPTVTLSSFSGLQRLWLPLHQAVSAACFESRIPLVLSSYNGVAAAKPPAASCVAVEAEATAEPRLPPPSSREANLKATR